VKTCPQCEKTFPDSERFCDADGSALISVSGPSRTTGRVEPSAPGLAQAVVCPVCGGKAEPGELICNFCGAQLATPSADLGRTAAAGPSKPKAATRTTFDDEPLEPASGGRSVAGTIGYIVAALVALGGGAWFAIHLSQGQPENAAMEPTPAIAATPTVAAGPIVALSDKIPVAVTGESAAAPERGKDVSSKLFRDNESGLMDLYQRSLASDPTTHDGMVVRLQVVPSGEVTDGKVRVSTAPNPILDAELVKTMMGWRFSSFGGTAVEVDYPIVFARNGAERDDIDSKLFDKFSHLEPTTLPEYASAVVPTPEVVPSVEAAAASPVPLPGGLAASTPAAIAAEHPHPHVRQSPKPIPTPKPSLLKLVQDRLSSDRRFNHVKAYTDNGTVTLFGKVFDDDSKLAAERAVHGVPGVTNVVDTLTTNRAEWAENEVKINRELQNAGLGKVTATVIGSDAYLKGQVTTDMEKQRAVTIAEQAAPVKVRTNLILVAPGSIF